jgi:hypothetical protein
MRSDFRSMSYFLVFWGIQDFIWWRTWVLMKPSNLVFLAYLLMLASHNLFISSVHVLAISDCPSCDRGCVGTLPSLAVSVILLLMNPGILISLVCLIFWESSCLRDLEILVGPSSWDPGILWSWVC